MGKKAYMGPMQDPNGINAQILPIWVPYIHVCWVTDLNRPFSQKADSLFTGLYDVGSLNPVNDDCF